MQTIARTEGRPGTARPSPFRGLMIRVRGRLRGRSKAKAIQQRLDRLEEKVARAEETERQLAELRAGLRKLESARRQQVLAQAHAIAVARSLDAKVAGAEETERQLAELQAGLRKLESARRQQVLTQTHAIAVTRSLDAKAARAEENRRQLAEMQTGLRKLESARRQQLRLHLHESAIEDRIAAFEASWQQHVPAFLNAVASVGGFGHELSRTQRQLADAIGGLRSKAGAIDEEFRGLWQKIGENDASIRGLRDSTIGTTRVVEDLWDKIAANEPKTGDHAEAPATPERSGTILNNENQRLCLHDSYKIRPVPMVFDDRHNKDEWQREVYEYARQFSKAKGLSTIVDYGCGSAFKLLKHFSDCRTIGYEVGETLDYLKRTYPAKEWRDGQNLRIDVTDCDLVICSDVIEHVDDPTRLMEAFRSSSASFFIISTPALELFSAWSFGSRFGPPVNPAHRCEWTTAEFHRFVSQYLSVLDHKVTNLRQATQMIVATRYEANAAPDGSR